jgi:O-antigen/teichoic acid export membrane protein
MLANLVYAGAFAVAQSFFAEGSYGEEQLPRLLSRAVRLMAAVILPVTIILAAVGPIALGIFGHDYSVGAGRTMAVLALASPAVAAYVLSSSALRITKQYTSMIFTNVVYAVTICGLAYAWTGRGLVWVALAWLVGNLVTAIIAFSLLGSSTRGGRLKKRLLDRSGELASE